MPDRQIALSFLSALAAPYAAEPRAEAGMTARILVEQGHEYLGPQAPIEEDEHIRMLITASGNPNTQEILAGFHLLPWGENPVAAQSQSAGPIFAVCTLLGPDGPIPSETLRMGLFWQRPNTYYALHNHDADETYVILAGGAEWTAGDDTRWRGAGDVIHHPSLMPHAFETGDQGLLAMWRWSGDINTHSYTMLPDPKVITAA